MSRSLNIQLTDELRRYVDECAGYSEFIRDLICKDRAQRMAASVMQGLHEVRDGEAVNKTAMDIFNEK